MSSLVFLIRIILILYTQSIQASIYEFYQIRGNTWPNAPDVNVILGPGATQGGNGNRWEFNVTSQFGADLTIELGPDTWGLSSTHISHYNIQFQGKTKTNDDGRLLIVISVGDYYFAQIKSLDTTSQQYQECPPSNSPLLETNVSKMINSATPDRYDRFCQNSVWNDQGFEESTVWPAGFFLYSNPFDNTLRYSWYHDFITDDEIPEFSSYHTTTFPANQGLKIYISGDEIGHSFSISRINLFYRTETEFPTTQPTVEPTVPTIEPTTNEPTTNEPTPYPTTSMPTTSLPTSDQAMMIPTIESDAPRYGNFVCFMTFVFVFFVCIVL